MVSSAIWLAGLILEAALIGRAIRGRFLGRYALFYSYLAVVFLRGATLLPIDRWWPQAYPRAYWYSQFFVLVLGCGVLWEIYRSALSPYPGAARMAQNVLPFLFVIAFSRVFVKAWNGPNWLPGATSLETERDLRVVQTALLAGLVALLIYYSVPLGRNLKGMILGYGFFLGTSLVHLTLRSYLGVAFQNAWAYIQPLSYLAVLSVWLAGLWSYAPAPMLEGESRLEANYQALLSGTRRQLIAARTSLARTMRP